MALTDAQKTLIRRGRALTVVDELKSSIGFCDAARLVKTYQKQWAKQRKIIQKQNRFLNKWFMERLSG